MSDPSQRIIVTVRGMVDEQQQLLADAKAAGLSLNNYVRQQLGLPLTGRRKKPEPQGATR